MASTLRVAIIGAGMAGLTCGTRLQDHGHEVELFDKGRGPGGRMSTRRVEVDGVEVSFDHGAQYFTARDRSFRALVETWQAKGIVAPWPAAGAEAWVGTPGMNAPLAAMVKDLRIHFSTRVERIRRDDNTWRLSRDGRIETSYDVVVIAVPAEQVPALAGDHAPDFAHCARQTPSQPCWTVLVAFDAPLPIDVDILRSAGPLAWAARNNAKPGRGDVEAWVIQASAAWTRDHLSLGKESAIARLLAAFSEAAGVVLPPPVFQQAHSWLYARSGANGPDFLWERAIGLGVCGDWLGGPRVECAWLSGHALAGIVHRTADSRPERETGLTFGARSDSQLEI